MRLTFECGRDFPNERRYLPKRRRRVHKNQPAHAERPVFCGALELRAEICFAPVGIVVARMPRSLQETLDGDLNSALAVDFDNQRREQANPITRSARATCVPRMTPKRGDHGTA
jgi:hypothetical protein